jgi:triosephosphate isomerase
MDFTNEKPFIAGNWKMFKTVPEAVDIVKELHVTSVELEEKVQFVVIPPFTALSEVSRVLEGSGVKIGAQNMHWEEQGAFTGEVAASMLKNVGCTFVVIGHSERRQYFGETNETVNKKIKAALAHDLTPIMCIGESLKERESGKTMATVEKQIAEGMEGLDAQQVRRIIVAYEPLEPSRKAWK